MHQIESKQMIHTANQFTGFSMVHQKITLKFTIKYTKISDDRIIVNHSKNIFTSIAGKILNYYWLKRPSILS